MAQFIEERELFGEKTAAKEVKPATLKNEVAKVEGLTESRQLEIANGFSSVQKTLAGYVQEFEKFLPRITEGKRPTTKDMADARELRLKISKVRGKNGVEVIHKEYKEYFLNGGRYVDSIKKNIVDNCLKMELILTETEEFEVRERARKVAAAERFRSETLLKYEPYLSGQPLPANLGGMDDPTWDVFYAGAITRHKAILEEKAEEERVEKERQEAKAKFERYIPYSNHSEKKYIMTDFIGMEREFFEALLTDLISAAQKEKEKVAEAEKLGIITQRLSKVGDDPNLYTITGWPHQISEEYAPKIDVSTANMQGLLSFTRAAAEKRDNALRHVNWVETLLEKSTLGYVYKGTTYVFAGDPFTTKREVILEFAADCKEKMKDPQVEYLRWVSAFTAPDWGVNDGREAEVRQRFAEFLEWAKQLKNEKV